MLPELSDRILSRSLAGICTFSLENGPLSESATAKPNRNARLGAQRRVVVRKTKHGLLPDERAEPDDADHPRRRKRRTRSVSKEGFDHRAEHSADRVVDRQDRSIFRIWRRVLIRDRSARSRETLGGMRARHGL